MLTDESADPGIFTLLLFGYSLAVLGVVLLITPEAVGALVFAIFVAAVAETVGGLWEIARGRTYIGSVIATFGIWLFGLFLLETLGRALGLVSAQTSSTYYLVLLVPIALLAIPAFKNKMAWTIRGAFVALFLLVLLAGVNFLLVSNVLGMAAGVFAWVSALCIWKLAADSIFSLGEPAGTS